MHTQINLDITTVKLVLPDSCLVIYVRIKELKIFNPTMFVYLCLVPFDSSSVNHDMPLWSIVKFRLFELRVVTVYVSPVLFVVTS